MRIRELDNDDVDGKPDSTDTSVLSLEAVFAGRGALPLFGDALPFLKS